MQLKKFTQKDRYGNLISYEFDVPPMDEIPHPGGPKGTDTVPAWLTPGENVVNAEASRLYQPLLDQMNDTGRAIQAQQGGPIPDYAAYGKKVNVDYKGNPYDVTKLYQDVDKNPNIVSDEIEKLQTMGLPQNKMMSSLKNNLNMTNEEAIASAAPNYGSPAPLYQASGGGVPKYLAGGSISRELKDADEENMRKYMEQARHNQSFVGGRHMEAGGVVIDDKILDGMMQVESGGDVNAVSEAGAIGPMQIMPSTAQNPGYGVKPISLKDLKDPTLSRDFARRYMQKLADRNPQLNVDEIKTAYHSGLGNVLKARSGEEALGPRGQEYAGKVNAAMGEVPPVQMASMSDTDGYNFYPKDLTSMYPDASNYSTKAVPESEDGLGNQIMSKIGGNEFDWDKAFGGKEANPFNKEFYEEDGFGDLNQFERSVKYPMEIFGMDVPPNAVGKPTGTLYDQANPVIEALNPSVEKINEGISSNALRDIKPKITSAKNDLDYMTTLITNIKKNGGQPNSSQIKKYELALGKHKKLLAEEKKIQGINQTHKQALEKESNKNKDFTLENEKKIEIAKKVIQETNTADYAEGKSELDKADDEWAKKNLTGEYEGDFAQNLINKAKEYGGVVVDKSIEFFKNAFSSMFDGEELARMAMIYAGSRAMGYDHGGSLNYSMKNYVKRVDANLSAAKKFALTDKAREDYTEKSLVEFSKTGKRDALVPKKANVSAIEFKGELFHRDFGKLGIVKLSNKQDGIRIPSYIARDLQKKGQIPKNADVSNGFDVGMNSPLIKGKTAKLNPSLHDATTMRKEFSTVAKTNLDAINAIETGSEKKKIQESPSEIANEAQSILTEHLRRFQIIDDNKASIFRREVDSSIADYYKALRKWSDNKNINGVDDKKNPKPTGIQGYFNKRVMILKTDGVIQPTDIANTTPENLMKLERLILQTKGVRKDPERYISIWEEGLNTWNKMKSRYSYSKGLADPGWDGFTLWMYEMEQSGDIGDRAKKLIEPSNLK